MLGFSLEVIDFDLKFLGPKVTPLMMMQLTQYVVNLCMEKF